MGYEIEQVLACENHLGESPIWDVQTQSLYWVDSTGRRVGRPSIWRYDPSSGATQNWRIDRDVGAMALREGGGAILACDDGFFEFDFESGELRLVAPVPRDSPRARLNDGKCDRRGRFIAGGMDDEEELPICAIWRLDPDHTVTRLIDDIICTNGPCWSPDDHIFYVADTFRDEMWAYDYDLDRGGISNRRVFATTRDEPGLFDGSTVDAEGGVWNAQVIGGELVRYAPSGEVDLRVGMPVKLITSLTFGGPQLDEIYVTSMARVLHPATHDHFAKESRPQFGAGSLFRVRGLGIRGLPEPRYGG